MNREIKKTLYWIITVFIWVMLAMVIISWIPPVRSSPVGDILYTITNPILFPIRYVLAKVGLNVGIDFSPLILYFGLTYVQRRFLV